MTLIEQIAKTTITLEPARIAGQAGLVQELPPASRKDSQAKPSRLRRAVVVHAGRRDSYQLALGLQEAGLLEVLVTDLFWSGESGWARRLYAWLPGSVRQKLLLRSEPLLGAGKVRTLASAGLSGLLLDRGTMLPFSLRRWLTRRADAQLGSTAGRLAKATHTFLVSYSYYGFDAFRALGRADILFQMHPHPATMRRLLREEMVRHPESAQSLNLEWELALPESDFEHLIAETCAARAFLVASSFTRDSLIEHGADPQSIRVIPYGVDLALFCPGPVSNSKREESVASAPLRVLFVGRINERKGLHYLLEALEQLPIGSVELTICGRVLDRLNDLKQCNFPLHLRPSVSTEELVEAYRSANLFVLPSIAEGFGQVLLEALACGLPILATSHTAAPDLIEDGVQGFIVAPQRADLLAERLQWGINHREELAAMGQEARLRAEVFSWQRFRHGVAEAVTDFMVTEEAGGQA